MGVADGLEPMGDHDDGLFVGQGVDGLHQLLLVLRIHVGGGLVQDDDGRVLHHGPSDGQPLPLTAGEGAAGLADDGVIALGQLHDEVVAAGPLRRLDDLFHGGIRLAEADVVGHGVVEETDILEYEAEIP